MAIVLADVKTICTREEDRPLFSNTPGASSWPLSRK
jgi:hypothetical protein